MLENTHKTTSATEAVSNLGTPKAYINPWMRFCARTFDIAVFSDLLTFIYELLILPYLMGVTDSLSNETANAFWLSFSPRFHMSDFLFAISARFCWCLLIEPILLSTWGSSPGKFLFNLHVIHAHGARLSYKEALQRGAQVWCFGMGLGIPGVSLVTYIIAYIKLKMRGATLWDKNRYIVKHEACGWFRKILITIIFIIPICLWFFLFFLAVIWI